MSKYVIEITDEGEVYINGDKRSYAIDLDPDDKTIDSDKKAIVSLADVMGYEPVELFEEITETILGYEDNNYLYEDEDWD